MNEDSVASCSRALEQIREREGWWVGWTRVDGVDGVEMLKVWPQISIGNIQSLRFPHFQQSIYIYWFQIPSRTPKNRQLHNTHLRWGKDTNRKRVKFFYSQKAVHEFSQYLDCFMEIMGFLQGLPLKLSELDLTSSLSEGPSPLELWDLLRKMRNMTNF